MVVPDQPVSETEKRAGLINGEKMMRCSHVDNPVLQFETKDFGRGTLLCGMSCNVRIERSVETLGNGWDMFCGTRKGWCELCISQR